MSGQDTENMQAQQTAEAAAFLYAAAARLMDDAERRGDAQMAALSDGQHTLTALCYLDSKVEEGGFVQLIAEGYGGYVFENPLAESLRRWRVKLIAKVIDKAAVLYRQHGAQIEQLSEEGCGVDVLRSRFPEFEELDAEYYEAAETDLAAAADYVRARPEMFEPGCTGQAGA